MALAPPSTTDTKKKRRKMEESSREQWYQVGTGDGGPSSGGKPAGPWVVYLRASEEGTLWRRKAE